MVPLHSRAEYGGLSAPSIWSYLSHDVCGFYRNCRGYSAVRDWLFFGDDSEFLGSGTTKYTVDELFISFFGQNEELLARFHYVFYHDDFVIITTDFIVGFEEDDYWKGSMFFAIFSCTRIEELG